MMAQVNAGRVRFVGRGEYNNSTQYYVFDLVSYNGNSYYAKADTIGNLPTNTTYWQLVAEKGNVGPTGLTGNGISSIEKTSTSGLVDTYTITYTNGNTTTFNVSNGNGIDRIEKTATVGNKDTYTIYFTNGSTTTYEVSNGEVTREELEEEVDRLSMIYNAFPTTTGEGEEASINGTAEVPFKEIGLKGNTSQESTTGKNLLQPNYESHTARDVTVTITDKGWLVNGTVRQEYEQTDFTIFEKEISAGTYTINGLSGASASTYQLRLYMDGVSTSYIKTSNYTFTLNESTTIKIVLYCYRAYGEFNNLLLPYQLETGSTASTYEPYTNGQAPNPDYPYPVNVVTGDNEVKVEGKNIGKPVFDSGFYILGSGDNRKVASRVSDKCGEIIKVKPSTNYTISGTFTDFADSVVRIALFDTMPVVDSVATAYYNAGSSTAFTTGANTNYILLYDLRQRSVTVDDLFVCETQYASTYEPYQSQTYPINLGSMELCKIGDYQDYLYKENGNWYKYGAIGKVVLDGSESYNSNQSTETDIRFTQTALTNKRTSINNTGYSNYFLVRAESYKNGISLYTGDNNLYIWISKSIANDISSFKTWVSTHNIEVYYPLSTPTVTPITNTTLIEQLDNLEKAYSYDTQTNISQTNQDKPFIISYEAILSLRNVLNS